MPHPKKYSAWGVIFKGEQCLFIKRSPNTSRPGQWCLPGGGNKSDEAPVETCVREVKEEVGLDVEVGDCLLVDSGFFSLPVRSKTKPKPSHSKPRNALNFSGLNLLKSNHWVLLWS